MIGAAKIWSTASIFSGEEPSFRSKARNQKVQIGPKYKPPIRKNLPVRA